MYRSTSASTRPLRRSLFLALAATTALVATGCESGTNPPPTHVWSGTLEGVEGFADLTGEAAIISSGNRFTVGVELTGVSEDDELGLGVFTGTCAEPGELVGEADEYPAPEIEEEDAATAEATISAAIDSDGTYQISAWLADETEDVLIACGDLTRS